MISETPSDSIILIEDIDCAFPSREQSRKKKEVKDDWQVVAERKSTITLSGLLNVLDGVTSEEGRLLFATTNYVDRLDPALLRPGRMDVKIHYKLSTRYQIINLFKRFYTITVPLSESAKADNEELHAHATDSMEDEKELSAMEQTPPPSPTLIPTDTSTNDEDDTMLNIDNPIYPPILPSEEVQRLAELFADSVPQNKYSVAELQGYLLTVRTKPYAAVEGIKAWAMENDEEKARIAKKEQEKQEQMEKDEDDEDEVQKWVPLPELSSARDGRVSRGRGKGRGRGRGKTS